MCVNNIFKLGVHVIIIMLRKLIVYLKFIVKFFGRPKYTLLVVLFIFTVVVALTGCWWFAETTTRFLLPPPPPDQNLEHFRRNRSLAHYMSKIQLLIEPSPTPCSDVEEVPVIILVPSSPMRFEYREAIRNTWAKYQPTYFVMGLNGHNVDEQLVDNYVEAKQYGDLVVFDFHDHYQNLTIKTALMIQWTLDRCPQAQFMFKADDDVFVNPRTLKRVLKENANAKLLGYRINNTYLHRDEYTKWYLPRWLCPDDEVAAYLTGPGYLISGDYLRIIFKAAFKTPLVNIEDVYFSNLVAMKTLGYELTHDRRLSPYKPWMPTTCAYWCLASAHSLKPQEMEAAWSKIAYLINKNNSTDHICDFYNRFFSNDFFLY